MQIQYTLTDKVKSVVEIKKAVNSFYALPHEGHGSVWLLKLVCNGTDRLIAKSHRPKQTSQFVLFKVYILLPNSL